MTIKKLENLSKEALSTWTNVKNDGLKLLSDELYVKAVTKKSEVLTSTEDKTGEKIGHWAVVLEIGERCPDFIKDNVDVGDLVSVRNFDLNPEKQVTSPNTNHTKMVTNQNCKLYAMQDFFGDARLKDVYDNKTAMVQAFDVIEVQKLT